LAALHSHSVSALNYGIRFSERISHFIGGCDCLADTPDPIPNSEVKRPAAKIPLGKIAAAAFFVSLFFVYSSFFMAEQIGKSFFPNNKIERKQSAFSKK